MHLGNITFVDVIATATVVMNIIGYSMRTMIPLRIVAMTTNGLFILYSTLASVYPTLILNLILLPINAYRLFQLRKLVRQVADASTGDLSLDWLKPFTHKRRFETGQTLFTRGDAATELYFIVSGRYRIADLGVELRYGDMLGELELLAPGRARTQTVECIEAGETLVISYRHVIDLYYENPGFGFYFLQLSTKRLFHTIQMLEAENAELRAQLAARTT